MSGSSLDASKVRADKALYAVLVKAHRANLDRYLAAQDTHKPASVKEAPHDPIITFDGPTDDSRGGRFELHPDRTQSGSGMEQAAQSRCESGGLFHLVGPKRLEF